MSYIYKEKSFMNEYAYGLLKLLVFLIRKLLLIVTLETLLFTLSEFLIIFKKFKL